jgi:hypothetical protein
VSRFDDVEGELRNEELSELWSERPSASGAL